MLGSDDGGRVVGRSDGFIVGRTDGAEEGVREGTGDEGTAEGVLEEGVTEGLLLGLTEGRALVGCAVVGIKDGTTVGPLLEDTVGAPSGVVVGTTGRH